MLRALREAWVRLQPYIWLRSLNRGHFVALASSRRLSPGLSQLEFRSARPCTAALHCDSSVGCCCFSLSSRATSRGSAMCVEGSLLSSVLFARSA